MNQKLSEVVKRFGDRAVIFPVSLLDTVKSDVETLKESDHYGEAAEIIVRDFYNLELPETDFPVRSLVLAAKAEPVVQLCFCWNKKEISVFTPNAYKDARKQSEQPIYYLQKFFGENGYSLQEWEWGIPLKTLAVRSGLAQFGRNNIAYVNGLGSRHSLEVFVSDAPCDDMGAYDLKQMERCDTCSECLNACPTKAICTDRKPIIIERCLTYLNEFIDLCDFPDWLDDSAHHGIHGCIRCQLVCPANEGVIHTITPVRFDEAETRMILAGISEEELPEVTRKKLEEVYELEYLHLLPRNLSAVFSQVT